MNKFSEEQFIQPGICAEASQIPLIAEQNWRFCSRFSALNASEWRKKMKISYNAPAMRASNALNASDSKVSKSLQRLSSGLKVTASKDNPSGYAIGRRMNTQITGIGTATQSSQNGISVIETADGALTEVHEMLQRMNELAVKGETGTLTTSDRMTLEQEVKQLKAEITRISTDTQFNGQTLLDGTFDLRGYTDNNMIKVDYYSDEVTAKLYSVSELTIARDAKGKIDKDATTITLGPEFPQGVEISETTDTKITLTGPLDFKMTLEIPDDENGNPVTGTVINPNNTPPDNLLIDITGIGSMDIQTGANEGQQLEIRIPEISLNRMNMEDMKMTTSDECADANRTIKSAILYVSDARSRLGAYQNRLEHTINNLAVSNENMTASYSRIMDVDMADEMTEYTTEQVISQAAVSMLAQANERPSQVLQLLQ